ncbi:OmpK35 protein [Klebsiella variicola]|nr:OmpK35 protein [Klebsiella variicola]
MRVINNDEAQYSGSGDPCLLVAVQPTLQKSITKTATTGLLWENGRRARLDHQWRHQQRRYTYARIGLKGETQINDQLTGYGQWEYNMDASNVEGSQPTKTRLAFAV